MFLIISKNKSQMTSCCTNHTCERAINTAQDTHVLCPLCRNAAYCAEECRVIDWAAHACPNAVRVEKVGTLLATPYFYEDEMPADIIGEELLNEASPLKESFLLHHVGTDMKVTQWIQQPVGEMANVVAKNPLMSLGRSGAPPEAIAQSTFVLNIFEEGKTIQLLSVAGRVGERTIHSESDDDIIKKVARASPLSEKRSTSILLWPDMKDNTVMVPRKGSLKAELRIDGKEPLTIEFYYTKFSTNLARRLFSAAAKRLQLRLKAKFPGKDEGIKYMQTLRATTRSGTAINLTFSVRQEQDQMELVDVEFLVPLNQLKSATSYMSKLSEQEKKLLSSLDLSESSIYCDATNISQMTGLTMALEYAQAQIKAGIAESNVQNSVAFENAAAIVRKHTRAMLDGKSFTESGVPMEVNAAVYTAVNALQEMQTIDISISKDRVKLYSDKLLRAGGKVNAEALAVQSLTPIVEELERIRSAAASSPRKGVKGWAMKKMDSAKKSRLDKQLDEWKMAIENYLNAQDPGTRFAQADALIRRGKNPMASTTQ